MRTNRSDFCSFRSSELRFITWGFAAVSTSTAKWLEWTCWAISFSRPPWTPAAATTKGNILRRNPRHMVARISGSHTCFYRQGI